MSMEEDMEVDYLSVDSDDLEWIVFEKGKTSEPFQEWLQKNLPSNTEKKNGIGWICVRNEHGPNMDLDEALDDRNALYYSWEAFLKTGNPVTYEVIKELALNHNVTSGKWLFFAQSGGKIDHLWSVVASAIVNNDLPCTSAKVSTYNGTEDSNHVVCIYNDNFTDYDQVMRSEEAIRKIGIKAKLLYKPNVYTLLGVYSGNHWDLTPNILVSNFDIVKRVSVVENAHGISHI